MVVTGLGAVGAALVTQHVFGMQPCAWCVLQRLIFVSIAAAALLGLLWRSAPGRRVGAGLALALAACGVSAALWQHFVAASSASCDLSLAERIVGATGLDGRFPDVFMAMASCADAAVKLGGLPYEFWSLGLFVVLGTTALVVLRRPT
jgi:disulfide bond formation protein DsbB